jgi:hypothetical protein
MITCRYYHIKVNLNHGKLASTFILFKARRREVAVLRQS